MSTHARGATDSVSVARLGLYGTIGTAIIGAVATVLVGVIPNLWSHAPEPATEKSDLVSFNQLQLNGTGGVTVSGSTENDVKATGVVVSIGPKPEGGYWSGFGKVENQQWQADVATEPPWQNYQIKAAYYYGSLDAPAPAPGSPKPKVTTEPARPAGRLVPETASENVLMFAFQPPPTTSPAPVPDELMHCVEQFGPKCFDGPEFGPTSVYPPAS
jgi:hypothetical protein